VCAVTWSPDVWVRGPVREWETEEPGRLRNRIHRLIRDTRTRVKLGEQVGKVQEKERENDRMSNYCK